MTSIIENSYKSQLNLFQNLISFANTAVFVNCFSIRVNDTVDSLSKYKAFESKFLEQYDNSKTFDENVMYFYNNNEIDYVETNPIVLDILLKSKLLSNQLYSFLTPLHVRKSPCLTIIAWDQVGISNSLFYQFSSFLQDEIEYQQEVFYNPMYESNEIFINLSVFLGVMGAILRVMRKQSFFELTIDSIDYYALDNFMASFGFLLFSKVELSQKSAFCLKLLELYRTKGSFNSLNLINSITANSNLKIYTMFLFFEKDKFLLESDYFKTFLYNDKPNLVIDYIGPPNYPVLYLDGQTRFVTDAIINVSKLGYYSFLAVDEQAGETLNSVLNNPVLVQQRKFTFSEITSTDPTWVVTETDLFKNNITLIKSKYIMIQNETDLTLQAVYQNYLSNAVDYLKNNGTDIYTGNNYINLYYLIKLYCVALLKKSSLNYNFANTTTSNSVSDDTYSLPVGTDITMDNMFSLINAEMDKFISLSNSLRRMDIDIDVYRSNLAQLKAMIGQRSLVNMYEQTTLPDYLINNTLDLNVKSELDLLINATETQVVDDEINKFGQLIQTFLFENKGLFEYKNYSGTSSIFEYFKYFFSTLFFQINQNITEYIPYRLMERRMTLSANKRIVSSALNDKVISNDKVMSITRSGVYNIDFFEYFYIQNSLLSTINPIYYVSPINSNAVKFGTKGVPLISNDKIMSISKNGVQIF